MVTVTKRIFCLLILLGLLADALPFFAGAQPDAYSIHSNSGTRHEICTSLEGTGADKYYTGSYAYASLSQLNGDRLLEALQKLMTEKHTYISTYTDCQTYASKTDCQGNDGTVTLLYSSLVTSQEAAAASPPGWSRCHVWTGFRLKNTGPGADLHHIRPADASIVGIRRTKPYGYASDGEPVYAPDGSEDGMLSGYLSSHYFEPLDSVKGDVARICLYLYVRYGGEYSHAAYSDLTNTFQSIDVLLQWCALDPVDTWEMGRNEVVSSIQGNRNVFIDYPELAWLLFDRKIPADMKTPSGKAGEKPSTPTVPTEATEATVPSLPSEPTEPTVLTEPTEATEPTVATESTAPVAPTHPTTPEAPSIPITAPTLPSEPAITQPTEAPTPPATVPSAPPTVPPTVPPTEPPTEPSTAPPTTATKPTAPPTTEPTSPPAVPPTAAPTKPTVPSNPTAATEPTVPSVPQESTLPTVPTESTVPICGHTVTELRGSSPASCLQAGYTGDTHCRDCGVRLFKGSVIPKTGHRDGNRDLLCDICQASLSCPHASTQLLNRLNPTCTANGYTGDTCCAACGLILSGGDTIPAAGHTDSDQDRLCDICSQPIPCPHRNREQGESLEASCGSSGYTGDVYCADCGELLTAGSVIPATKQHSYTPWTVTVEASSSANGLQQRTCTQCGATESQHIPMTPGDTGFTRQDYTFIAICGLLVLAVAVLAVVIRKKK